MSKHLKDLKEIQDITSKIKRMNESIMFEDDFDNIDDQMMQGDEYTQELNTQDNIEHQEEPKSLEDKGMEELDKLGALDKIRLICLDGMKELAKQGQPDSPQFVALNKIFGICNKGTEEKEENTNK